MTDQPMFTQEVRPTLFKERMFSGTHHYFFEVKVANNGSRYIVVEQRKKVGEGFVGTKMRIFEDELPEFRRTFDRMMRLALNPEQQEQEADSPKSVAAPVTAITSDLSPAFFERLATTHDWQEFERYSYLLLKLLGIQSAYHFFGERQAGKPDGFFKFGNLAVIYDCTLDRDHIEETKRDQIINYCNRLKQGSIEVSGRTTEEFYGHVKQVWIVTQGTSRKMKVVNNIEVKEISVRDIMAIYLERLTANMSDQNLELRLSSI